MTTEDLIETFGDRDLTPDEQQQVEIIRNGARDYAQILLDCTPTSKGQTKAIELLREVVFWAGDAVRREGR